MKFEAEEPKSCLFESIFHHVKGGHLFRHKQHGLGTGERRRYDVGDRLRFSGAGWTFNRKIFALHHIDDGAELRRISIGNEERHLGGGGRSVDFIDLREKSASGGALTGE